MLYLNIYNFLTPQDFENYKNTVHYLNANSVYQRGAKWLVLTIPMVSGHIIMEDAIQENLQHELEHLFQGKNTSNYVIGDDKEYANARSLLTNSDDEIKSLALVVYLSNLGEQDAFVNGLYTYLMAQEIPMIKIDTDVFKKSDAYIHLSTIRDIILKLESNDINLNKKCLKYFNKTSETMLKLAKDVEFRFSRKIGKIFVKYYKDIRKKYVIHESFTTNTFNNRIYFTLPF